MQISRQEAAAELLRRRATRTSLAEWGLYKGYKPAKHHLFIISEIEKFLKSDEDVLLLAAPPGSAKSRWLSVLFPSWYLAQNPTHSILAGTHNIEFARRWGRMVRNDILLDGTVLGISVSTDNAASDRWSLASGGEYYGVGAGVGISGFRADLGLGDDFFGSREDAFSEAVRRKRWDWYIDDFSARLKPGSRSEPPAKRILMNCMAGDTPVLMATGLEKPLREIRAGDEIVSYDNGALTTSKVRNWINHGPDKVYEIRMKSGTVVRANARHPFLVEEDGRKEWRRTAGLKPGNVFLKVITENGVESHARNRNATNLPYAKDYATRTTINVVGAKVCARRLSIPSHSVRHICAIATELTWRITTEFLPSRTAFVPSVNTHPTKQTLLQAGAKNSALITATIADAFEGFFAMTATSLSGEEKRPQFYERPPNTLKIIRDVVEEIAEAGTEDVFDIEVERTENFIANGLVSHNTRWHEEDVAGRVLEQIESGQVKGRMISIPAVAEANDPLGRYVGQYLWDDDPDYDYPAYLRQRQRETSPMMWSALYQQRPAPEEGLYFQREWFQRYTKDQLPADLSVYGTSDYAVTEDDGDYTTHRVWGISPDRHIWMIGGWRGQTTSDVWIEKQLDLVEKHQPLAWFGEGGVIQKAVEPFLKTMSQEREVYCWWNWLPSIHDKPTRARGFQARASMKMVHIPAGPEGDGIIEEYIRFPAGKNDDDVDCGSLLGRALDDAHPATVAAAPTEPDGLGAYKRRAVRTASGGWKTR